MRKIFSRILFISCILLTTIACSLFNIVRGQDDRDITAAILTEEDVPAGFERLSEDELADEGLTGEELTAGFNLQNARCQNISAFLNDDTEEYALILGLVIYPLSRLEILSTDIELLLNNDSNDQYAGELVESFGMDAAFMPEAFSIGDRSMGVSYTPRDLVYYEGKGSLILFRQDNALAIIIVNYIPQNPVDAIDLAEKLNFKLETALN